MESIMNTWKKLSGDVWGVLCGTQQQPGDVVTVTNRSGATKTVTLGAFAGVDKYNGWQMFAVVETPKPATAAVGDLTGVLALFDKAKANLKYPAIVLSVPELSKDDYTFALRLSIAGPKARVPGSVTVLDAAKGDDGREWLGRITVDGQYQPSNKTNGRTEAIVSRLRAFAADPAKVAAEHGKLTGSCCFCNKALTDERSTNVGYGKTCSEHYGLPWGK
jgi:hypothetical protein